LRNLRLQTAIAYVRESGVDSAALLVVGFAVGILGILGIVSLQLTLSVATALLSLVAAVMLRSERQQALNQLRTEDVSVAIKELLVRLESETDAARVLRFEYPDLQHHIAAASRIDVVAGLVLNVVNQYQGALRDAVARGAHIRLLCPNPSAPGVVEMSLFRSVFRSRPAHVTKDVESHLEFAASLRGTSGEVEIHTIPYLPPFGIIRTSGGATRDTIHVKLMAFKVGAGQFPVFSLYDSADQWFKFFVDQLERYYAHGTPYHTPH
jgi:hypothetical protein